MVEFKLNIGDPKQKKTYDIKLDKNTDVFIGKKIGDKISGDLIGFDGYEFEITGGTDNAGFPMLKTIEGTSRKKILAVKSIGLKKKKKGIRKRKTVAGNTIYEKTAQINLKIIKYGKEPLIKEENKEESK